MLRITIRLIDVFAVTDRLCFWVCWIERSYTLLPCWLLSSITTMLKKGKSSNSKTSMTPSLGFSGRVQPPEAARRRTDRPPDPEATSRLPQNFDVEGEGNHGSDGDEAHTPPADRSQYGPRDVDRTPSASLPDRPAAGTTTTTGSCEENSSLRHHPRRSSP